MNEARLNANRANATHSTGPVTDSGKQTSSRNAFKHGLTARQIVIPGEDPAAYQQLHDALYEEYAPVSTDEIIAVEHYIEATWRYQRVLRMETAFLNNRVNAIQADNPGMSPDEAMSMLFVDAEESKKLKLFMRYLNSAERAYNKTYKTLCGIIATRPVEEELPSILPSRPAPLGFVSQATARPPQTPGVPLVPPPPTAPPMRA